MLSELLDAWERQRDTFWPETWVFLSLVLRGLGLALLIGLPAGMVLSRLARVSAAVVAVLALLQAIPGLVMLALLLPLLKIGEPPALCATVVYCLFPIVMNTYIGLSQVPLPVREAARGMGMTSGQILWRVELPLALPVILAGVRTGAIYAIGVVTLSTYIGAGGLGDYVSTGLSREDNGLIWLGTLPILVLTITLFWGLGSLARLARWHSSFGMTLAGGLIVLLSSYASFRIAEPWWAASESGRIRIGTKDFTEGQILTEILKQMLETHTNLEVEKTGILGTNVIFRALQNGDIDLYPEYTGVLLTSKEALDLPVPKDKSTITALVRKEMAKRHQLVLLETFGLNNTYVPCLRRQLATNKGLQTISDLRRAPQLRVTVDQSFLDRPDGWRGMVEKYKLHFNSPPRQLDLGLRYRALEENAADLVIGFATDWQITALDLIGLKDDLAYFPSYHGAPLVRADVLKRHPEIGHVLNRLHGRIDDDAMRRMNFQVAREKRSEKDVAREFLEQQGLLAE